VLSSETPNVKAMLHRAIFLATCSAMQCNSTLERCQLMKSVKNFRYVERKTLTECNEDSYLVILHLSKVELHCKLQEKLHRVTWP
jgi:hypothetical protein